MSRYDDTARRLPILLLVLGAGVGFGLGLFGTSVHVGHLTGALAAYCLLASAVVRLRPGWATWLWGRSAASNLLGGIAFACMAADTLYEVPRPDGYALMVAGIGSLAGSVWLARAARLRHEPRPTG